MQRLVVIHSNIPICPNCRGLLKLNEITNKFKCVQCEEKFKIIDLGKSDRDFICECESSK